MKIEKLIYSVTIGNNVVYEVLEPLKSSFSNFDMELELPYLTIIPKIEYESIEAARKEIDIQVYSYETYWRLSQDTEVKFSFDYAETKDEGKTVLEKVITKNLPLEKAIKSIKNKYPLPPNNFCLSPDVDSLLYRFNNYLNGKENILGMAYFCLTLIESKSGIKNNKRKTISNKLKIDDQVLGMPR